VGLYFGAVSLLFAALPYGFSWLVAGIEAIRRSRRCVSVARQRAL